MLVPRQGVGRVLLVWKVGMVGLARPRCTSLGRFQATPLTSTDADRHAPRTRSVAGRRSSPHVEVEGQEQPTDCQ
jgi:hypothetical protein